jgi:hypothetical protein
VFEDQQQDPQPPARPNVLRRAAVATALVAGVVAGGYGVAAAQSDETPTTQETPTTEAPEQAPDGGTGRPDGCDRDGDGTPDAESSGSTADASL